jgi:hypothetical protein
LPPATTVQGARGARTNQWVDGFAHGVQRTTLFKCFGDFFDRQPKKQCHQYIIDQKIKMVGLGAGHDDPEPVALLDESNMRWAALLLVSLVKAAPWCAGPQNRW